MKKQKRPLFPQSLNGMFWTYIDANIGEPENVLDKIPVSRASRPPVFATHARALNLLAPADGADQYRTRLLAEMPAGDVHLHFGSMKSSQALALSVFGCLKLEGRLNALAEIKSEDGFAIFGHDLEPENVQFEHEVKTLGEPRPTSIDVRFKGKRDVMVECKFTENGVGSCSRPRLRSKDNNFKRDYCDGSYRQQNERQERCSLTQNGIKYWGHIPELFGWDAESDLAPCPLRFPYQLVRNVLAAVVDDDGALDTHRGHAVLVYDERNPTFQAKGPGMINWNVVKSEPEYPELLQKCSWQEILKHLRSHEDLRWLTDGLSEKYGF
jgi:Restriction Endonuclease associating with ARP